VARLLGSWEWEVGSERWLAESGMAWEVVLAGFREVRPFSAGEERLARVLTRWTPLITLGNWLQWLLKDRRRFTGTAEDLNARLQRWSRVVVARLDGQLGAD
jgi:Ser/Thr protein kinase RdoA (MazF antagonist)